MNCTFCDFCGNKMKTSYLPISFDQISVSVYGTRKDICDKCADELIKWMKDKQRPQKEGE